MKYGPTSHIYVEYFVTNPTKRVNGLPLVYQLYIRVILHTMHTMSLSVRKYQSLQTVVTNGTNGSATIAHHIPFMGKCRSSSLIILVVNLFRVNSFLVNAFKDSFDRFGDDLCEELLSYLSFEDRFRWECVSKQWQRVLRFDDSWKIALALSAATDLHYKRLNSVDILSDSLAQLKPLIAIKFYMDINYKEDYKQLLAQIGPKCPQLKNNVLNALSKLTQIRCIDISGRFDKEINSKTVEDYLNTNCSRITILVIILTNYYLPEVNGDKGLGVRSNEFRIQFLTPRPIVRQSTTQSPEMAFGFHYILIDSRDK
ncbi:unnamed protein product [Medioppia subpectinata]|uniref:F-box domain-containing protein n=1 Tax=Medioppia subpectinata TaxID=1979941 RepID=A0A7R9L7A8_9ACAR|nr:unnamed protein product [Medioppia subpectinata]CAG2115582.1 unnamed protein product [Medioppia subpectinata]